jgi:tyrosyl-tRNA synthetase
MTLLAVEEQLRTIVSGTMQIVPLEELKNKLARGVPLNIKLGVDPTSPDLHLGHAVPLRKMRQFQDLGHKVTLIIGNGTALIGDPSGRDSTRPQLTSAQVEKNAKTYVTQAMKILDPAKTEIVHNGDWILSMNLDKLLGLLSKFTVARILEREDFSKRYAAKQPIALHEFIYPVMQAYDSVMVKADVEMGGNDQIFNLLAGRDLMGKMGMEPQVALTMPLLEGTDGVKKMSKSYGNYVGLTDAPDDMYGKLMSIPDTLIGRYYRLCSTLPIAEIDRIDASLAKGTADPYELKRALARNICDLYHGAGSGDAAQAVFDKRFKEHVVVDATEFCAKLNDRLNDSGLVYLPKLLADAGLANSAGDGRRKIDQGGVKVNGQKLPTKSYNVDPAKLAGATLQAGKLHVVRLV